MSRIDVPIPELPGAYIEYEASEDKVEVALFFAGIKIASETIEATAANAEGFGYVKYEKTFDAIVKVKLTFEIWVRWKDRKVVLVVLYKAPDPIGSGKREAWGDF